MMEVLDDFRSQVEQELQEVLLKGSAPRLGLGVMNAYQMGFCDQHGHLQDKSLGKYMRPVVCLAMCAALGGNPSQAVPAAAALQIAHRTSLIFDDIQDHGIERNNQPTVNAIWGSDQAINAGFALSCYARLILHRMSQRGVPDGLIVRIDSVLEKAVIELCQGQYMDISFVDRLSLTVADYMDMVRGKTGVLFGAACEVGAIVAEVHQNYWSVARQFGINMGIAFQIHDDYLGIWGDEATVGKTANDLIEKKRSLPVVLAMGVDNDLATRWLTQRTRLRQWAKYMRQWMENKGIPDCMRDMEMQYAIAAQENLDALPVSSQWQPQLKQFLALVTERKK